MKKYAFRIVCVVLVVVIVIIIALAHNKNIFKSSQSQNLPLPLLTEAVNYPSYYPADTTQIKPSIDFGNGQKFMAGSKVAIWITEEMPNITITVQPITPSGNYKNPVFQHDYLLITGLEFELYEKLKRHLGVNGFDAGTYKGIGDSHVRFYIY